MKLSEISKTNWISYIFWSLICLVGSFGCQSEHTDSKQITEEEVEQQAIFTAEKELRTKVQTLLGQELNQTLITYRKKVAQVKTFADFVATYKEGLALRNTLVELLGQYIESSKLDSLPDLFWLKKAIPLYQPQLVAEGTEYYLFNDYKQWLKVAKQTASKEDDEFIALNIALFPEDSIEYFYPVWFMQTWDYGGSSLLGRKTHQKILKQATAFCATASEDFLKQAAMKMKENLLKDILSKENTYWEQQKAILVELDTIIYTKYPILSQNDLIALQKRRAEFEEPKKYGIQLNLQAGE